MTIELESKNIIYKYYEPNQGLEEIQAQIFNKANAEKYGNVPATSEQIKNQKEKILFLMLFLITHSLYIISFFDHVYFSSIWWRNPFPVSSQLSLIEPLVYVSTIIFLMIFVIIYLRVKIGIPAQTGQVK